MCLLCTLQSALSGGGNAAPRLSPSAQLGGFAAGGAAGSWGNGDSAAARAVAKDAYTGLLSGYRWQGDTITVGFPSSSASYDYKVNGFQKFSSAQRAAVKDILSAYESFADINFVIRPNGANAQIRLAETNSYGTAYAFYPSSKDQGGDVWVNSSKGWYDVPVLGNYAYFTLMHELGHALGLKHGHEAGRYGKLPTTLNGMPYSVMTYASYVGQRSLSNYQNAWDSYAQTPMLQDIKALQALYGANFKHNAGRTTYAWDPGTGALQINGISQGAPAGNRIFQTIWDGGGRDTYDLSRYTTAVSINLNPGAWSTFSEAQLANLSGDGRKVAPGNVANAYLHRENPRSLIENAIGGTGADTIIGNIKGNRLDGGGGADTLIGNGGNDTYITDGQDIIIERAGRGRDTVLSSGDYTLASHLEILRLLGTGDFEGHGNNKKNSIYGNSGNNTLSGGLGSDSLYGGGGDDTYIIATFDTRDRVYEVAAGGIDSVESAISYELPRHVENLELVGSLAARGVGNGANNILTGNSADNLIDGRGGEDRLFGREGDDILIGGVGIDTLVGGSGADEFRFLEFSHLGDVIEDFTGGVDKLSFSRAMLGSGVSTITDVSFELAAEASGSGPMIYFDAQTKSLKYDADGEAAGQAVLLCHLAGATTISQADILII